MRLISRDTLARKPRVGKRGLRRGGQHIRKSVTTGQATAFNITCDRCVHGTDVPGICVPSQVRVGERVRVVSETGVASRYKLEEST